MEVSSFHATEDPDTSSAELDICTFEMNIKHEVIPSVVCSFFFSLGLIYCFFGTYSSRFYCQSTCRYLSVVCAVAELPELLWQVRGTCQGFIVDELKAVGSRWLLLCLKLTQAALMKSHLLRCLACCSFKSDKGRLCLSITSLVHIR